MDPVCVLLVIQSSFHLETVRRVSFSIFFEGNGAIDALVQIQGRTNTVFLKRVCSSIKKHFPSTNFIHFCQIYLFDLITSNLETSKGEKTFDTIFLPLT